MLRIISDIRKYFRYSIVAAKAQLEAEVANSYLNWIWWVLEPFCTMMIYAFIFGTVFGMKTENYAIFIFIGISLNDFFNRSIKNSVKIIKRNKPIITKIYMPKFILIASDLFVNGFKMIMCLIVVFAMMLFLKIPITWNIIMIIPILIDLYIFTFAICVILSHFGVFVEDLANVINIVLKFLFYFTGIFYSIQDKFPKQYSKLVLRCYPIAKLIDYARNVCIDGISINVWYLVVLFAFSICMSVIGIHIIYKNENSYVKLI